MQKGTLRGLALISILFFISVPGLALGEQVSDKSEWGLIGSYPSYYDDRTVTTFTGEIIDTIRIRTARCRDCYCLALVVKQVDAERTVYLGPMSYVKRWDVPRSPGQIITVTGSAVTIHGRDLVLANEITEGEKLFAMRDDDGHLLLRAPQKADTKPLEAETGSTVAAFSRLIHVSPKAMIP
jgi:hypothetical protein